MSNPAPTLNQINAFNATIGTTIDFNIIGGTEVIRSNKIYIYDLSDNSLICTHLYVSTESIHELPPNTSSSIVYASGKSSADFTNNTQYYAQIQTFTDTNGTQGASGLSIAKLFWCLPTPTLTLGTIPTTISTTSYNVSATYTPNTSGSATNEIQEFQFNLYSAIGALLQTSGVVLYGEGVDLSYNFSGLEVDSTYYVTLDVTTTQGMNVNAQSNTFTISIDTPTMGSASVVNNGCDGYISVTSNLSSEHSHSYSVDAGEIMSFTTDSPNDVTKLQVDFNPIQDGTPWMSTPDTEPYTFRAVPTQTEDFGHESDTIVGGTVAWNQLVQNGDFASTDNWSSSGYGTIATSNNVLTLTVTDSGGACRIQQTGFDIKAGHKYLLCVGVRYHADRGGVTIRSSGNGWTAAKKINAVANTWLEYRTVINTTANGNTVYLYFNYINTGGTMLSVGDTIDVRNAMVIDLTQMFGSTIADYIYSLEQANTGAGVAWFKKLFPKPYYAYNAGELMSVNTSAHNTVGFNAWDEEWELGGIGTDGTPTTNNDRIRSKNYVPIVSNTSYYFKAPSNNWRIFFYDADKNFIEYIGTYSGSRAITTPNNARYLKFWIVQTTYNNDICINLSWDGERDGEYEEYVKHSYPLDSSLTLRGIPKLDASNNLYYDGDEYNANGSVDRRYGVVDLGTLNWTFNNTRGYFSVVLSNPYPKDTPASVVGNALCVSYVTVTFGEMYNNTTADKVLGFTNGGGNNTLYIKDTSFNGDYTSFKTAMNGVYLVYELATPTTETADPFTNPQIVDPSGTEEYVGSPIPVGHKTTYQRICQITGWTEADLFVRGANLWDGVTEQGGYSPTNGEPLTASQLRAKNYIAIKPNTSYLTHAGNQRVSYAFWFDANKNFISSTQITVNNAVVTSPSNAYYMKFQLPSAYGTTYNNDVSINYPSTDTSYHAYNPNSAVYNITWQTEAGTVYGGTVDLVSGVLTVTHQIVDLSSLTFNYTTNRAYINFDVAKLPPSSSELASCIAEQYQQVPANGTLVNGTFAVLSAGGHTRLYFYYDGVNRPTGKLVYELATPTTYQLTPHQLQTLTGQNNLWSNTNGGMSINYELPITDLLVKRRDVSDVSGQWLTLYSVPINEPEDMDFTYIDFLNEYGKTYQYALVPVLAQDQSGVVVQIEGGYTVSDNVDSIFDGVYIADQTNVERVKAGVGYGNIDMNQGVGSITPIGSKYPIVITNSQNQYHNGSIRGIIVPNDFYSNGNLSRIDMVNKRDELEQFLTNKRAKIIKDWNGKMWLVMIMSNVSCTFDDNYGMGMVSFNADWVEVGDPTNQQDLYNAGLINVGGA